MTTASAPHGPCGEGTLTAKGLERQRKILDAAREVFLEQGFENASICDIMKRAGGSMSTLYRQFGNKLGLFEAMMGQCTAEMFQTFDDMDIWSEDIYMSLMRFGKQFSETIDTPGALAMFRLVTSVGGAEREQVQRIFYEAGPSRLSAMLAGYLEQQKAKGRIAEIDCEIAAWQFLEMVKAPWHPKARLGMAYEPDVPQRALKQAVRLFMYGLQVAPSATAEK